MANILLTGFPTMGGSGLIATKLGIKLAEKGHNIHFMFYKEPFFLSNRDLPENITFHKLEVVDYALFSEIGSPYTIQAASKISEIVKNKKIDIVHSHYTIPHAVVNYLANKLINVRTVATAHGSDTHTLGQQPNYKPIISLALKDSSAITAVSKYLAMETQQKFELKQQKVEVVHNFIETSEFTPSESEADKSIILASNFRPVKQIPLMIEIFAKISDRYPDWRLKLVGYGPEYPLCIRKALKLKIRDKVEFLGVRKDVPELIRNSSVLASSSKIESFGLTIAEGMSCSLPIWAPNVGGIPEICIDNENGYLYDLNNKEEAADKLADLLSDESKRRRYGKNGRNRIIENFSPKIIVARYENVYERIINC